ncbi:hypothetical protein RYX36_014271 [Vicia faba]
MDVYFENPNPFSGVNNNIPPPLSSDFINLSDYLELDDDLVAANQDSNWSLSTETPESSDRAGSINDINVINQGKRKGRGINESTVEVSPRVTFRTRSQFEIMDDGYKWRKYGKKFVKNNSNPRNYYKCSGEGCGVKKRVERDREDTSYVLTSYDGVHNHESPCTSYYTPPAMSLVYSNEWQLQQQPSANSSSSS